MPNSKRFFLGGIELPLDIDTVEALPASGGVMEFDFSYRDVSFAAKCIETDGSAVITVVGNVGRLPYSAEAPAARSGLSHIIMHANGLLGRIFRLTGERIMLHGEAAVQTPVSATHLLSAIAGLLIPVSPYLDLAAVYFEPGGERLKPEWRIKSRAAPPGPPSSRPMALPRPAGR